MDLSKTLFAQNIYLLSVGKFCQNYNLKVENTFVMGEENPSITLKTKSEITIEQETKNDLISNRIELLNIVGETENETLKPFLEQSLALAEISKNLYIKRNKNGKILSVEQKDKLKSDWELWKNTRLRNVFATEKEQAVFAKNYENGLKDFDQAIKNNLQYIFLLPEIYSVIFPPDQQYILLSDHLHFTSRLVTNMEYSYQMKLVKLDEEKEFISLELHAILNNLEAITKSHLENIYNSNEKFTLSDFNFSIKIKYELERSTARIISGTFIFCEKLHNNLSYTVEMELNEILEIAEIGIDQIKDIEEF